MPRIVTDAALRRVFTALKPHASVALAVSGGPDSMALMHLASRWRALAGRGLTELAVLTVDHGLRPASKDEADFVALEAARIGLPHATLTWAGEKPRTGIQAAARRARYDLMTAYCRTHGIACLATAHTADDQAETFLMHLARGSGLDGLAAMAAVSERGGVSLARPLLTFSKRRILAYLHAHGIPFVSDPSNSNVAFERVRLRHAMKALAAAGISRSALALSASRLGRSREALMRSAAEFLENNFSVSPLGQGEIGAEAFDVLPAELALRALAQVLALVGGKEEPPQMAKVERLLAELKAGRREAALGGCLVIAAPAKLQFFREPGRLKLPPSPCQPGGTCIWDGRFALSFAPGLSGDVLLTPLGERGWTIYRRCQKDRPASLRVNRLAALTTPALWQGGELLAAPALGYAATAWTGPSPLALTLAPRLSHFLKRT